MYICAVACLSRRRCRSARLFHSASSPIRRRFLRLITVSSPFGTFAAEKKNDNRPLSRGEKDFSTAFLRSETRRVFYRRFLPRNWTRRRKYSLADPVALRREIIQASGRWLFHSANIRQTAFCSVQNGAAKVCNIFGRLIRTDDET